MISIKVTITGNILKGTAAPMLDKTLLAAYREAGLFLEGRVSKAAPVNRGILRASISSAVKGSFLNRFGRVFSPIPYALPVETGQTAHMPPVEPIQLWVTRKLRLSGKAARRAAWGIAVTIKAVGKKGKKYFEKTFKDSTNVKTVQNIFQSHLNRLAARLNR